MRQFFTALILFSVTTSFAQTSKQIDSVSLCFNSYKVPTGCAAPSEYQLECDDYKMIWLYVTEDMLQTMPAQFVDQVTEGMKKVKKETITCYLLDKEVQGYKLSYKRDNETAYQLIAYGVVNGQPVIVQVGLTNDPKTNEDIPEFPRQIIRLTK